MIKVIMGKEDNKIVMSQHIGTVDLSDHGLSAKTSLGISINLTTPMVHFDDGTVIGLDYNAFIRACVEKYKSLQEDSNNVWIYY